MWPAPSYLMPPYMTTGLTFGGRTYHEAPRYVVYSSLEVHPASSRPPSTRTNLHHVFSLMWLDNKPEDILYRPVAGILWIYLLFGSSWLPLWSISICHKCLRFATFLQDFLAILVLQFARYDGRQAAVLSCPSAQTLSPLQYIATLCRSNIYTNAVAFRIRLSVSAYLRTDIGNNKNKVSPVAEGPRCKLCLSVPQ